MSNAIAAPPQATEADRTLIDRAAGHLVATHSPRGKHAGWLLLLPIA